ncbi:hypothetical protein N9X61_00800 [Sulfurimonas sp.]|nr:hypothetical protein [Sulfurimonas sp.]
MSKTTTDINQLDFFYRENFSGTDIDELCHDIAETILEKYFISNIIDNATYEREIFKIIKKLIISHLQSSFNADIEFNVLFSVYIFKKHFKLIFSYLSEYLMQEVAYSNQNVINFLKYYSLDTLVVDRKKYVVPQIKESNGARWNVISMLSILKTYIKALDYIDEVRSSVESLEKKVQTFHKDGLEPHEYNELIEKKYTKLTDKISKNAKDISIIHDSLTILKDEVEISSTRQELQNAENERIRLREEKAELIKLKIKQIKILEYNALVKKYDLLKRDIKPQEKLIEQNNDAYISIKNALTKALISKKQAI